MVEKKRHFWQRTEVEESGMSVEKWVLLWGIGRLSGWSRQAQGTMSIS